MKTKKSIFEALPYYYEKEKCAYVSHTTLSFVFVCQVEGKHPLSASESCQIQLYALEYNT